MQSVSGIPTCDLADAMTRLGMGTRFVLNASPVSPRVSSSLHSSVYLIGTAHTSRFAVPSSPEPVSPVNAVDSLKPGQVLVIAGAAGAPNAYFGGLLCARAVAIGAAGAVVDGRVRDLNEVCEHESVFPVMSTSPVGSVLGAPTYAKCVQVGGSITLCSETAYPITINEGDIIVGDVDGVVCVPADRAEEVAALAKKIQLQDAAAKVDIVESGFSLVDAFKKHRTV